VAAGFGCGASFVWPSESVFDFCKTGLLPYDAVVVACLAVAEEVLGESMTVEADRAIDG
jgi:hypothetical protein